MQVKTWSEELIDQYKEGRKQLVHYKNSLSEVDPQDNEDRKLVGSMISDMSLSIDWLKKGRRPGNRRGIDRRSAYQRTAYAEMDIFPADHEEDTPISKETRKKMVDVLLEFSYRERQCYLMHMAKGLSYAEIAEFLGVTRSSVQRYVERSKSKIKKII